MQQNWGTFTICFYYCYEITCLKQVKLQDKWPAEQGRQSICHTEAKRKDSKSELVDFLVKPNWMDQVKTRVWGS